MLKVQGPEDVQLHRFLEWAARRQRPLTITYLKQSKDENGTLLWEKGEKGHRKPVLETTIRTIEPFFSEQDDGSLALINKAGTPDAYVRAMERDSRWARSWRLDRIQSVTYHRRGKQLVPAYVNLSNTKRALG